VNPISAGAVFVDETIVFGVLERRGKGYTGIVPNTAKKPLQAAIRGQVVFDSIIHSDGWRGYDGLVDRGYNHEFRFNPREETYMREYSLC